MFNFYLTDESHFQEASVTASQSKGIVLVSGMASSVTGGQETQVWTIALTQCYVGNNQITYADAGVEKILAKCECLREDKMQLFGMSPNTYIVTGQQMFQDEREVRVSVALTLEGFGSYTHVF